VRAVLSDRYCRLDNYDLAENVLPILQRLDGGRFESVELTETKMYLKVVTPCVEVEIAPGERSRDGVRGPWRQADRASGERLEGNGGSGLIAKLLGRRRAAVGVVSYQHSVSRSARASHIGCRACLTAWRRMPGRGNPLSTPPSTTIPSPEKIPHAMAEKFYAITALTDAFCERHLDDEYQALIHRVIGALARKRPSPLLKGKESVWAAPAVFYTRGGSRGPTSPPCAAAQPRLAAVSGARARQGQVRDADLCPGAQPDAHARPRARIARGRDWYVRNTRNRGLRAEHRRKWLE
jgi:hypothetical protein